MSSTSIEAKKVQVQEVAEKIQNASSTVVVEYRGLTVAQVTDLRRQLRAEEIEFKVYKNSIVRHAVENSDAEGLTESLVGPNAIAFGGDAVAPARILANFAKTNPALVLKTGIVEGKVVDTDTLNQLAKLPNRDGMISKFMSCLQSPVRSFACVVKAVADAKAE